MTVTPPDTLFETNLLFTQVAALAECLCEQIQDPSNGVPDVCSCGVIAGDSMAPGFIDGNCNVACGAAWVRVTTIYPMKGIGNPDTTVGNCGAGVGADIEMGIVRCMDVGGVDGAGPSAESMLAAAQLQYADAMVMRKAVQCCPGFPARESIMGSYAPVGPAGGMVGGMWTVRVAID